MERQVQHILEKALGCNPQFSTLIRETVLPRMGKITLYKHILISIISSGFRSRLVAAVFKHGIGIGDTRKALKYVFSNKLRKGFRIKPPPPPQKTSSWVAKAISKSS
jgi:hypothetical protein